MKLNISKGKGYGVLILGIAKIGYFEVHTVLIGIIFIVLDQTNVQNLPNFIEKTLLYLAVIVFCKKIRDLI